MAVVVRVAHEEDDGDMGEDDTRERATFVDFIALEDDDGGWRPRTRKKDKGYTVVASKRDR